MAAMSAPEIPGRARTTARLPLTGRRRLALALGVPVCLLLVAYTGLDLVALFGQGSYPVSYTVPAGQDGGSLGGPAGQSLSVSIPAGQLVITGTDSRAVTVAGTARYSLVRSTVTESRTRFGNLVGYRCAVPVGNCALDATVSAPASAIVQASTGGGNVAVVGTEGVVTLSTGGGDISVSRVWGPLMLDTSGGNIRGNDVSTSSVSASSGGGDVDMSFSVIPSDVEVHTSGGNITLILPPGQTQYKIIAHAAGGTVSDDTIPQNTTSDDVIDASTGGGDITIGQW